MNKLILGLFLLVMTQTGFANSSCYDLEQKYNQSRNLVNGSCAGLTKCQETRSNCDQELEEKADCENFSSCMKNQFPQGNSNPMAYCTYSWDRFSESCKNTNQSWHPIAPACPGYTRSGGNSPDHDADVNLNCAGHKSRYLSNYIAHIEAFYAYSSAIKSGRCSSNTIVDQIKKCPASERSVR